MGVHTIYFMGPGERIEVSHQAHSRETFAQGRLAGRRLAGEPQAGQALRHAGHVLTCRGTEMSRISRRPLKPPEHAAKLYPFAAVSCARVFKRQSVRLANVAGSVAVALLCSNAAFCHSGFAGGSF